MQNDNAMRYGSFQVAYGLWAIY